MYDLKDFQKYPLRTPTAFAQIYGDYRPTRLLPKYPMHAIIGQGHRRAGDIGYSPPLYGTKLGENERISRQFTL